MRKLTFLATLLLPALVCAHLGSPLVVDLFFPTQTEDDLWVVVTNRGIFARQAGAFTLLCDDAIVPEPRLQNARIAGPTADTLVATGNAGLYRSTDAGCSWSEVPGALSAHVSSKLLPHPDKPAELLTVTETLGIPNDVFLTENGGETWTAAGIESGGRIRSIIRSPADPSVVYATHFGGSSRSDDGGRTFVDIALGPDGMNVRAEEFEIIAGHPMLATTMFATVERFPESTLVRTDDGGASWTEVVVLPDAPKSMVVDEVAGRMLLATPFEGMFRSEDGGESWDQLPRVADALVVGCLRWDPAHERVWACGRTAFGPNVWVVGSTGDLGDTWRAEMDDFDSDAVLWDCPADSQATEICSSLCLPPDDPACAQPADGSLAPTDAGVADAAVATDAAPDVPADTETSDGSGDCRAAAAAPVCFGWAFLLSVRRRRRR